MDHRRAPATELAALYPERWEYGTALNELKTHLRGPKIILRSKTPHVVRQEFYGPLLAPYAIRRLMHEAALEAGEDPDRTSFHRATLGEILQERAASSRQCGNPRAVKRNMSRYGLRPRARGKTARLNYTRKLRILK